MDNIASPYITYAKNNPNDTMGISLVFIILIIVLIVLITYFTAGKKIETFVKENFHAILKPHT